MLKEERQKMILDILKEKGIIKISEILKVIDITEMTIRRDFQELHNKGLIKRIHGGAKLNDDIAIKELSHNEKQTINIYSKIDIAKKASQIIENGDTLFLGVGTTIEVLCDYLKADYLKIVTNSIYVFNKLCNEPKYELILVGGSYRARTGAFVGIVANNTLSKINISKAFVGVNAICDNVISNYGEDEGMVQSLALNNASKKYILADSTKLNKNDFYHFYNLEDITSLITDDKITKEDLENYSKYTNIIY